MCPFAVPPMAGLHGMCATVSVDSAHRPTSTPSRAAANAASTPAWPAPITMTSNTRPLLADTEPRENVFEQILGRSASGDFLERGSRLLEIGEQKLLGDWRHGACAV